MASHGTSSSYTKGCRCDLCRKAWAAYQGGWRARNAVSRLPAFVTHGSISTYNNWSCRCRDCRDAMRAYHRSRRAA